MHEINNLGKSCCGCEACLNACPSGCITMVEDREGFRYPAIDATRCKDCGMCTRACPQLNDVRALIPVRTKPETYAAYALDPDVRQQSSSGGVFSVLAQGTLDKNGVVSGAVFGDAEVYHTVIENLDGLTVLRGSKYVQSVIKDIYQQVKTRLRDNRCVLFVGTPCQVAGLYGYLGRDDHNLITCDLVCHGVPSSKVFRLYIKDIEHRYASHVKELSFRDKSNGWNNYSIFVRFEDGKEYRNTFSYDPYMYGFLKNLYLRPSCHQCRYATLPRLGDITLGDFWGVRSIDAALDDDKGVSLVLVNSLKGKELLSDNTRRLFLHPAPLAVAIAGNPILIQPVTPSPEREKFFIDLYTKPFKRIRRKYLNHRGFIRRMSCIILKKMFR